MRGAAGEMLSPCQIREDDCGIRLSLCRPVATSMPVTVRTNPMTAVRERGDLGPILGEGSVVGRDTGEDGQSLGRICAATASTGDSMADPVIRRSIELLRTTMVPVVIEAAVRDRARRMGRPLPPDRPADCDRLRSDLPQSLDTERVPLTSTMDATVEAEHRC